MHRRPLSSSTFFLAAASACLMFTAYLLPLPCIGAEEDPRIAEIRASLDASRKGLKTATNELDRVAWQRRIDVAQSSLTNITTLIELETREKSLVTDWQTTSDYALQRVLTTIETSTSEFESVLKSEESAIRRLKARRRQYERPGKEGSADDETAQRLRTLDAEIFAHMLRRDTAELQVRLAREAARIDEERRKLGIQDRATIRTLFAKRREASLSSKQYREFERLREAIRGQREETLKTVQYARDSLGCFDQRVNLLDERYRILRETAYLDAAAGENLRRGMFRTYDTENMRQLKQMASGEQTAKKLMEERIAFLDEQALAMESYLAALDQGSALFHAYSDFLNDAYDALKRRFLQNIIAPVAMLIVIVIVYLFISRIVLPALYSKDALFVARRIGGYACFAIALMMLSGFFLEDLKAIATVMGLVGAAVVIALQDLCSSFAGWFVIVAGRKIRVGDRVEIDGHRGEIIDIQILRTTLLELNNWLGCNEQTGRTMFIPNSFIFKSSIFNFSHIHPYINDKLDITVTFETDPQKAFDTLFRCLKDECKDEFEAAARGAQAMEKHYGGAHVSFEPHIHTVIADSGVCYSLFFVAHYRRVTSTRDRVMKRILAEFAADQSLQFAYPTLRNIPTPTGPLVISQPKV